MFIDKIIRISKNQYINSNQYHTHILDNSNDNVTIIIIIMITLLHGAELMI